MWSRVLRATNHFDTFLQIAATPETKFEDEDDTCRAVATRYTTARRV